MSTNPSSDLAYRVLRLEQQLDSYQQLHAEELNQIRQALMELKERLLALVAQEESPAQVDGETRTNSGPTSR